MPFAHILLLRTLGIRAEHQSFCPHLSRKGFEAAWQARDVVSLLAKTEKEVVHRGDDLHAACQQGIFARTLEIADGNALVLVGFCAQREITACVVDKHLATFHLGSMFEETFLVLVLCADAEGRYAAINLWNDNACVLRTACHGLRLIHPVIVTARERVGCEKRYVVLIEPMHEGVVAYPSHRHVNHRVGLEAAQHLFALFSHGRQRIHVHPSLREHRYQRVDMLPVAFHGEGYARDESHLRTILMIHAFFLQIGRQLISRLEIASVLAVVVHVGRHFHGGVHLLVAPAVGGGNVAQVAQAVAVVLPVVVVEIALERGYLPVGEIAVLYEVAGAQRLGEDGNTLAGCLLDFCHLSIAQENAPRIDDDGVEVVDVVHLIGFHARDLDVTGVVVEHEVGLLCLQRIHNEYARGRHPVMPCSIACHTQDDGHGNPEKPFVVLHYLLTCFLICSI